MRDLLDDGASRVGETAAVAASHRVLVVSAVQEDNVMIKKILMGLGIAVLVLIAIAAIGVFYMARQGERLDASSKAYANRTIPLIVSTWSEQALVQNASPELLHVASKADFDRYFAAFAKLGPLVHYDGAKGQSEIAVLAGKGKIVTAHYVAHAKFAHGSAEIDLGLIRVRGHWKIDGFHVNSPSLL